ncbi:hypothetical protein NRI_0435 [Neorickettsia risticii str. Illinois]|uniref:Uncharacterized protein n=1 Tax=Neorickettsia risticii (strain Illinois) TaxID=434131 RepID=C6V4V1_NEORI|nr:hypothetical protein NRI_0435 [Neorickettsia risticii str. Illinois]
MGYEHFFFWHSYRVLIGVCWNINYKMCFVVVGTPLIVGVFLVKIAIMRKVMVHNKLEVNS